MPKTRIALMLPMILVFQSGCFDGALIQGSPTFLLGLLEPAVLDAIGPTTVVAVAESSNSINSGQFVLLNGSNSFVRFGSGSTISASAAGLTYAWAVVQPDAGGDGALVNADSSQATFMATTPGIYTVTLTVTDTELREGVGFVTVTVN